MYTVGSTKIHPVACLLPHLQRLNAASDCASHQPGQAGSSAYLIARTYLQAEAVVLLAVDDAVGGEEDGVDGVQDGAQREPPPPIQVPLVVDHGADSGGAKRLRACRRDMVRT